MWKDYLWGYLKNNRASGMAVIVAALISALFLSLLSSLFYNFWKYDVDSIIREEGDWQARLTGELDAQDLAVIKNYANVSKAVINEKLPDDLEVTVDLKFKNMRTILKDMPRIAELAGLPPEAVQYHHSLLNLYLVRDPGDPHPRLVFPVYLGITVLACISLVMIIHNSFAVSMQARIHQFGIFSSIGATPKQIRTCLLQEAAALCAGPLLLGNLAGIAGSMGLIRFMNYMLRGVQGRIARSWSYHPLVFAVTLAVTVLTIWISAWMPAVKMSRLTPLEAIKHTDGLQLKRKKNSRILAGLFGIEGELAGNALKAQRKALRTAAVSLVFSFLAFTLMQCFFTLSRISTDMTYFTKYQDAWDIMMTVQDTAVDSFAETEEIQKLDGVRSGVVYQKAAAKRLVREDEISVEMQAFGGFGHASEPDVTKTADGWLVNVPIVILDDNSFLEYCEQIGASPGLDGAVILNQIRDVTNANFRSPIYYPYLNAGQKTSILQPAGKETQGERTGNEEQQGERTGNEEQQGERLQTEIPVIAYTQEVPVLREEYASVDYYELVHFVPAALWKRIRGQIGGVQEDTYVRILAEEGVGLEELRELENMVSQCVGTRYDTEIENRIQEKISNDEMLDGMMIILGGFCVLLAMIGIGNVFSNTLGFVQQRKREFARYLSVGMTQEGIRKMFCIEALVIASRPVLITLPLTVIAVGLMIRTSYLEPMIFIRQMPAVPILLFVLGDFVFVALAYYFGWRKLENVQLTDVLRDDTMI